MAEITFNRVGELPYPFRELRQTQPKGISRRELLAFPPQTNHLTEYQRTVRLVTIPPAKAGRLVKNNRRPSSIPGVLREACRLYPNVLESVRAFLCVFHVNDHGLLMRSARSTNEVNEGIRTNVFGKTTLLHLENFYDSWIRYCKDLCQEAKNRFPLIRWIFFLHTIESGFEAALA